MKLSVLTFIACLTVVPAQAKYSGGTGEPNDPYQIATAADLIALGETPADYGKHFILTADIDLDPNLPGRKVFDKAVIAPDSRLDIHGPQGLPFTGVFDGGGHTISHLTLTGAGYLGLLGRLELGAMVMELGLVDVKITGSGDDVGGLVGSNSGTVARCYSAGTVSGTGGYGPVGGLVGYNSGTVAQCHSTGIVSGNAFVGGLMGYGWGDVACCYSSSMACGRNNIGGLVGFNAKTIVDCYATGSISGNECAGGLVGSNHGAISNCYSVGGVTGTARVGGLVGDNSGPAICSFWNIETSGQTTSAGGTGKTTAQLQRAGTFLDAGWDFVGETANGTADIWWILEGKDYPCLWWELPIEDHVVLVIDDFESYTDDIGGRIYETWIDGYTDGRSGSIVGIVYFPGELPVHGGKQSMPFDYNNVRPPYYSEAYRSWDASQDWTIEGIDTLTLSVRGQAGNKAEALYVAIEDWAGKSAVVTHPDSPLLTKTLWTAWRISVSDLAGVNPAAVKKMYIGVGDRENPLPGGTGRIWIDDICLTKRAP